MLPPLEASPPAPSPPSSLLVGRARERRELAAVVDELHGGRGRLLLITGDPGIGKTRLAEELAREAAASGALVLWSQCSETGGAPAYWPWSQVLRRLAAAAGPRSWQAWTAGLDEALAPLTTGSSAPSAPNPDAEAARFASFDAATRLLRRAATRPLLLILEDLHAADLPSLLLLEFIARELDDVPLAIAGTVRPADAEQRPAIALALARLARAALRLPLAGLAAEDVARLLDPGGEATARDVVAAVYDATGGNPLFVVETARALRETHPDGLAGLRQDRLHLASGVRDAVRARLARLSPAGRGLLELAAVFADQADVAGLQLAGGVSLAAVLDAAREGVAAGVLADGDGGRGIVFRHALLRDVLYEDLPPERRRALHLTVARTLAQRHVADPGPQLAALAHHFRAAAGDAATAATALDYTVQAARRAAALCADEEAIVAYRQALALREHHPAIDGPARGLLLVELAEALTRIGEHTEARPVLRAAAELARADGDAALLARAAVCSAERGLGVPYRAADPEVIALCDEALARLPAADSALRVRVLARAAVEHTASDDAEGAAAASAAAVAMARRLGEPVALAHALSARHAVFWRYGAPAESLAVASEIAAIGAATADPDLVAQGRSWRLFDHMLAGDALAFDDELAAYVPLAESLRRPRYLWLAENARALRALWQGRFADAEAAIHSAQIQVQRVGDAIAAVAPVAQLFVLRREQGRLAEQEAATRLVAARFPGSPVPQTFLAMVYVELARLDEARAAFETVAAADFEDLRREHRLGVLPYLCEVCAALGDADRAARLQPLLAPLVDRVVPYGSSIAFGLGAHWLALLADTMGRHDEARALAEQAVARHATMDAPPWLARSRLLLARLLPDSERERARELAGAARTVAHGLGMTTLAGAADALLAALVPLAPGPVPRRRGVFRRDGAVWTIGDGEAAPLRLRPCKGFHYIAALLRQPGRALTAVDLAGLDRSAVGRRPAAGEPPAGGEYARLSALRDQLDEAERFHDRERASQLRDELERRAAALAPRGRRRPGSTPAERARLNVTRTVADAVRRIAAADPALGRHFESAIRTGTLCSYVPDPRLPIDWEL